MKRKVCVVITARPSYSRIKTALQAIVEHPDLELQLVVTGSAVLDRFGNTSEFIEKDFPITAKVYMVVEGENLVTSAKTAGLGLVELSTVFDNLKPDMVVTIADRYETLATATAAAFMNIPLVHIQGGEVSGSIDEKVRHSVTKLADLHLVATEKSAERVLKMGESDEKVFITGCPSIDLAAAAYESPSLDFDPLKKYGGVGTDFNYSDGYLVVMQHPVTTEFAKAEAHITETLFSVTSLNIPTFWFWPNVDAGSDGTSGGIRSFRETESARARNLHFFKNMLPQDFLRLLINSKALIGNSSVGIRECSFLGVPVVNIGSRQEGRERGRNVVDVGYHRDEIIPAIQKQASRGRLPQDSLYGNGKAGMAIADILARTPLSIEKRLTY